MALSLEVMDTDVYDTLSSSAYFDLFPLPEGQTHVWQQIRVSCMKIFYCNSLFLRSAWSMPIRFPSFSPCLSLFRSSPRACRVLPPAAIAVPLVLVVVDDLQIPRSDGAELVLVTTTIRTAKTVRISPEVSNRKGDEVQRTMMATITGEKKKKEKEIMKDR